MAWGDCGVVAIELPAVSRRRAQRRLAERIGPLEELPAPRSVRSAIASLRRHLGGRASDLSTIQLDFAQVSPFARKVYGALRCVPPGKTIFYGELAALAGSPGAARAVGRAMATNPFPIVVPCHRVLARNGAGGFSAPGGLTTKAKLLALEGVRIQVCGPRNEDEPVATSSYQPSSKSAVPYDVRAARRHLRRVDPELAQLMKRVGPFRLAVEKPPSTFHALAESIVYQQLTGKAAATIFRRVEALGRGRQLSPPDLAAVSDAQLRAAGLSRAKTAALRDLAQRALSGTLPTLGQLRRLDDAAIEAALTSIRGIGVWTVQMLLIFTLGRPDVLPANDLGVRKGYAVALGAGVLPTPTTVAARGERWRPYRSVASWYLWRANDR